MKKYKLISKKGEGTFSEVVEAENIETGKHFAIKCMKSSFDSFKQVNSLREIQALRRLTPHPHIVGFEEVLYDEPSGRLAMVFELMDQNLYDLISGRREHLDQELVRRLGYQLFTALAHMHGKGIFHRDIKPENVLCDATGETLKLADLGSCRSINTKTPMTEYIATRWYRSPECLLTDGHYGPEMDIWGAGCVLFEVTALFSLFPGADEVDQVNRIHKVVGSPTPSVLAKLKEKGSSKINYSFPSMTGIGIRHFIPHASSDCVDLLNSTMIYDHKERIVAQDSVDHQYFSKLHEKEKKPSIRRNARVEDAKQAPVPKESLTTKKDTKKVTDSSDNKLSRRMIKVRNSNQANSNQADSKLNNLKSIKSTLQKTNARKAVKSKSSEDTKSPEDKVSDIKNLRTSYRRRNPTLQKTDAQTDQPSKPTTKKKNKYSNITSSGYGRPAYKAGQPKQTSAGTEKTVNSSLAPSRTTAKDSTKLKSNRLQRNKLSISRTTDTSTKRRVARPTRLPPIEA